MEGLLLYAFVAVGVFVIGLWLLVRWSCSDGANTWGNVETKTHPAGWVPDKPLVYSKLDKSFSKYWTAPAVKKKPDDWWSKEQVPMAITFDVIKMKESVLSPGRKEHRITVLRTRKPTLPSTNKKSFADEIEIVYNSYAGTHYVSSFTVVRGMSLDWLESRQLAEQIKQMQEENGDVNPRTTDVPELV